MKKFLFSIFGIFSKIFKYDEMMIVCYRDAFFSFSNKVTLSAFSIWFLQSLLNENMLKLRIGPNYGIS